MLCSRLLRIFGPIKTRYNMRYFIRAVKQFVYTALIFVIVIVLLRLFNIVQATDIPSLFKDGYLSLLYIALFLAAISAIYPKFGYMKKRIDVDKAVKDSRRVVATAIGEYAYVKESETDNTMTFRRKGFGGRLVLRFEDRITVDFGDGYVEVEGLRQVVAMVSSRIEYRLTHPAKD